MEVPSLSEAMDIDVPDSSIAPMCLPSSHIHSSYSLSRAKDLLLDRYMTYLLKTSQKLASVGHCTALVPYQELPCVRIIKDIRAPQTADMMVIDPEQALIVSLKRKRCEDEVRFVPKMMKLQCCL